MLDLRPTFFSFILRRRDGQRDGRYAKEVEGAAPPSQITPNAAGSTKNDKMQSSVEVVGS